MHIQLSHVLRNVKNAKEIIARYTRNDVLSDLGTGEIDWAKVPKDTPVLVWRTDTTRKLRRYFAEFKEGKCWTYQWGTTSWSNDTILVDWENCELAFPEQAKGSGTND